MAKNKSANKRKTKNVFQLTLHFYRLVLLLIAIAGLLYYFTSLAQIKQYKIKIENTSPNAMPLIELNNTFQKRQFNPYEKFSISNTDNAKIYYEGINPRDILSIPEDELVSMKCQSFNKVNYQNETWWSQINDDQIKMFAQKVITSAPAGQRSDLEFYCETEKNSVFITYKSITDPYDYQTLKYTIARVENGELHEITTLYDPNNYYPYCVGPLELKTNGDLYVECNGGDTSLHYRIYKVNMNRNTQEVMLTCQKCSLGVGCDLALPHKNEPLSTEVNYCK
jgi:hypothetical protein